MTIELTGDYTAIFGTTDGYTLVLQARPYYVEQAPTGEHVISRRGGNPGLEFGRQPLRRADLETLWAEWLDSQGNVAPRPELVAYFEGELKSLKTID